MRARDIQMKGWILCKKNILEQNESLGVNFKFTVVHYDIAFFNNGVKENIFMSIFDIKYCLISTPKYMPFFSAIIWS